ncbi:MAG: DUF2851 family protein [Bacteroidales bacterium]|nr:DUF2851 family protein [Bacteroidales bacterium]MDT8430798.1 DUF2851 family protein [Bacteroidales bacterium]
MRKINEEFLHFLWKNQQLTGVVLTAASGRNIRVLDPGQHNLDAGPDFFNAKVGIDDTLWAGNVELHINASDWIRHGHSADRAYDSVILHVVCFNDCEIRRPDGQVVPTAMLRFPTLMWDRYTAMMNSDNWIACQHLLPEIAPLYVAQWTSSLMVEKLRERATRMQHSLEAVNGHWDAMLSTVLFRSFGLPVNTTPFEMLALLVPYPVMLRNKDNLFALEALLFGKSGMLHTALPEDKYVEGLHLEYNRFTAKLGDQSVPAHAWKFMRMRPSSFPSLRIAQLSSVIRELYPPHQLVESRPSLQELQKRFRIRAGDYWNNHFMFGKVSGNKPKYLGRQFIHALIINGIAPYMFFFGKTNGNQACCDYAIHLLEELPPEHNAILKKWSKFGLDCTNAFDSQALLFLYKNYCREKRCLECQFGNNAILDGKTTK